MNFLAVVFIQHQFPRFNNFPRNIPTFIFIGFFHGKIHQQLRQRFVFPRLRNDGINGFLQQSIGIQRHFKGDGQL